MIETKTLQYLYSIRISKLRMKSAVISPVSIHERLMASHGKPIDTLRSVIAVSLMLAFMEHCHISI
jgi:hypothetical protein